MCAERTLRSANANKLASCHALHVQGKRLGKSLYKYLHVVFGAELPSMSSSIYSYSGSFVGAYSVRVYMAFEAPIS